MTPEQQITSPGAHKRLTKARGKATKHQCVDCGDPAHQWSYVGEPGNPDELIGCGNFDQGIRFSLNCDLYEPRCLTCHHRLDGIGQPAEAGIERARERYPEVFGDREILTRLQAAERLGISPQTFTAWTKRGTIAVKRVNCYVYVSLAEVERIEAGQAS